MTTASPTAPLRSVELFAGAAGLGIGLAQAGFHHEIVVEHDHAACETIRHNQRAGHPLVEGWNVVEADVESVDLSDATPEPDLLSGGPPCQDFSIGGKHKGHAGSRNMWPWTISAVRTLRPRAFVFENVPALARSHRDYLDYLKMALRLPELASPHVPDYRDDAAYLRGCIEGGVRSVPTYRVQETILHAAEFGVAQNRSRLFLVGIRDDVAGDWTAPEATHSEHELMVAKWITGRYWDEHGIDRPEMDDRAVRFLRKHNQTPTDLFAMPLQRMRTVRDAVSDLPAHTAQGAPGFADHVTAPREAKAYKGHTGSPYDDPSKTLRAGDHGVSGGENMIAYPDGSYRHFTVREAARIQSFPDDYAFPGTWSDGLKQLGNAVPAELARHVGLSLSRVLH